MSQLAKIKILPIQLLPTGLAHCPINDVTVHISNLNRRQFFSNQYIHVFYIFISIYLECGQKCALQAVISTVHQIENLTKLSLLKIQEKLLNTQVRIVIYSIVFSADIKSNNVKIQISFVTQGLYYFYFNIRGKFSVEESHDFPVWLRICSNLADINRYRCHTFNAMLFYIY